MPPCAAVRLPYCRCPWWRRAWPFLPTDGVSPRLLPAARNNGTVGKSRGRLRGKPGVSVGAAPKTTTVGIDGRAARGNRGASVALSPGKLGCDYRRSRYFARHAAGLTDGRRFWRSGSSTLPTLQLSRARQEARGYGYSRLSGARSATPLGSGGSRARRARTSRRAQRRRARAAAPRRRRPPRARTQAERRSTPRMRRPSGD